MTTRNSCRRPLILLLLIPLATPCAGQVDPPAAPAAVESTAARAESIVTRARDLYRRCSTYTAHIGMLTRAIREGSNESVDTETYFTDLTFSRPWSIRADTTEERNGIDGDRCWCAMPESRTWMDATLPAPDARTAWVNIQHWVPYAGLGLWKSIAGLPDAPPHIGTTLSEIKDVREREYEGRAALEIIGLSPHPWGRNAPPVETTVVFDRDSGALREIAWESTARQRQQDSYRAEDGEHRAALKQAWYVLKISREKFDAVVDPTAFAPPADYKKVPILAGPRGYSAKFIGNTVPGLGGGGTPDLNRGMFRDGPWIFYVGLLGDDLDQEPGILSMEWLHDTLSPRGLKVLSVGHQAGPQDMAKARAWANAHDLQHRTIAGQDGMSVSLRMGLQSYWPVILLADGDATVQAAFTGYSPAFSLALREWAIKLMDKQPVWTAEELAAIRQPAAP